MVTPLEIIDSPEDLPRPSPGLHRSPPTPHARYSSFANNAGRDYAVNHAMNGLTAESGWSHNQRRPPSRPHTTKPDLPSRRPDHSPPTHVGLSRPGTSSLTNSPPLSTSRMAGYPAHTHNSARQSLDNWLANGVVPGRTNGFRPAVQISSDPTVQTDSFRSLTGLKRPRDESHHAVTGRDTPPKKFKYPTDLSGLPVSRQNEPQHNATPSLENGLKKATDIDSGLGKLFAKEPIVISDDEGNSSTTAKSIAARDMNKSPMNRALPSSDRPDWNGALPRLSAEERGRAAQSHMQASSGASLNHTDTGPSPLKKPPTLANPFYRGPYGGKPLPTKENSVASTDLESTDRHPKKTVQDRDALASVEATTADDKQARSHWAPTPGTLEKGASPSVDENVFRIPAIPSARDMDQSLLTLPLASRVERVLGKYVEELRTDTEHWTRAWLRRARCARKKQDVIKETVAADRPYSFANYKALQLPTKSATPTDATQVIVVEVQRGPVKIPKAHLAVPVTHFTSVDKMPSYNHYVHIQNNFLALNETIMHYQPYFSEEFDDAEAANMRQHYFYDAAPRPRKLWQMLQAQSYVEYVDSALQDLGISWADVLHFFLEEQPDVGDDADAIRALRDREKFCRDDFAGRGAKKYLRILASLPPSTPAQIASAASLCEGFMQMAKLSLWHVARIHLHDYLPARKTEDLSIEQMTCRVCFRYDCPIHGEINQEKESDSEDDEDDDASEQSNEAIATDIIHPPKINYRTRIAFPTSSTTPQHAGAAQMDVGARRNGPQQASYKWKPEERKPFYPCHHPGTSCEDARCRCFREHIHCEKTCTCSPACHRRFQGCRCSHEISLGKEHPGRKTMCFQDDRCACFMHGRECDPDLCGPCRVADVLDPVNLDDDQVLVGRCRNASIQRGVTKHTLLGDSAIHGFGLYAGDDIKPHDFIGEYKGEIITRAEAERRGAMYEHQKLSYLFNLNESQEIDSTYFGNKIRFINHAGNGKNNLYPRLVLVNNVHRIALYGARSVKKGYELFFDYGPLFPEAQLGKGKKDTPQKNTPNNAGRNALLDDFYEIGFSEDEKGNYRARKVAGSRSRPGKARPGGKRGRKPKATLLRREPTETGASTPSLDVSAGASSASLQPPPAPSTREDDELSRVDPGDRMMSYNIAPDDDEAVEGAEEADAEDDLFGGRVIEEEADDDEDYHDAIIAVEDSEDESRYSDDEDDGPPTKRRGKLSKKRKGHHA